MIATYPVYYGGIAMERVGSIQPSILDVPIETVSDQPNYNDYLCLLSRHRDSDSVSEVNFREACLEFGITADSKQEIGEGAVVLRFGHWAVGWYEILAIDPENEEAMAKAKHMEEKLEDYPVLNEEALSEYEWNEIMEAWYNYGAEDQLDKVSDVLHDMVDDLEIDKSTFRDLFEQYGGMLEHGGNEIIINGHSVDWEELATAVAREVFKNESDKES